MMRLAILDCGSGNLLSIARGCQRAASVAAEITNQPEALARADAIILPGVGAFAACKKALAQNGLLDALEEEVTQKGKPFLGICVGMQILADFGVEHEKSEGLGWIKGQTKALIPAPLRPVPHMGWNDLNLARAHTLSEGLQGEAVYFAHSYIFCPQEEDAVLAFCDYGETFPAFLVRDNIAGVQFHPEKSAVAGQKMLANFCEWRP